MNITKITVNFVLKTVTIEESFTVADLIEVMGKLNLDPKEYKVITNHSAPVIREPFYPNPFNPNSPSVPLVAPVNPIVPPWTITCSGDSGVTVSDPPSKKSIDPNKY